MKCRQYQSCLFIVSPHPPALSKSIQHEPPSQMHRHCLLNCVPVPNSDLIEEILQFVLDYFKKITV